MPVRNISGLSPSARKWVLASYAFNAKLKIDSLSYIAKYHRKIPTGALHVMIEPIYLAFFIECAAVIDNHIDIVSSSKSEEHRLRKELQENNGSIEEIYKWRDKFAAHHDLDALGYGLNGHFSDWRRHIAHMQKLLYDVTIVCKENLPEKFTLDYVVHDPVAYRLVHKINNEKEEEIYNTKYPFRNMEATTDGPTLTVINSVDEACRYLRTKNVLAKPNNICVVSEMGINDEESLQNQQNKCLVLNVLYDKNIWCEMDTDSVCGTEK